ncbi:MAG: ATP-binding protein [Hyphomicrobium sp.]|nr:ATP-binding protein [Hyphomicrobium sp.]
MSAFPRRSSGRSSTASRAAATVPAIAARGSGLTIVKSLVELHGGTVSLESEPGRGTRVTVRLPVQGRPDKAAHGLPQEGPEGPLSATGSRA